MQILEYRKNEDPIKKGFFDIMLEDGLILRNLCFCQRGNNQWINLPSRKSGDVWIEYFTYENKQVAAKFKEQALRTLKGYLEIDERKNN